MSDQPIKWGHRVWMSREMQIDLGMVDPTPEEAAARAAQAEARRAEREAEMLTWRLEVLPRLAGVEDRVSRAVLDLHTADLGYTYPSCEGCDHSGHESEPPDWPCRTVRLLAAHHGIALPDGPMPHLDA